MGHFTILRIVTHLGDSALLLPASMAMLAYMLYRQQTRIAAVWAFTFVLCAVLTIALKICFDACATQVAIPAVRSPSGHASLSSAFYACSAVMAAGEARERWQRRAIFAAAAGLIGAIAASRVILGAHTVAEVGFGLLIGLLCVGQVAQRYLERPAIDFRWRIIIPAFLVLILITHRMHLDFEHVIDRIAAMLRHQWSLCA
jgi:membrane-associated phospholipid phosphatase